MYDLGDIKRGESELSAEPLRLHQYERNSPISAIKHINMVVLGGPFLNELVSTELGSENILVFGC